MLSQRRAFAGESAPEVLTAILKEDPPELSSSDRNVPPGLARIVHRCLEKRPEDRFHSAHDLALALEAVSGSPQAITGDVARRSRFATASPLLVLVAIAAAVLSAVLAACLYLRPAGADLSRYRFTPFATDAEQEEEAAWSPDGRSIAYAKVWDGKEQIFVRSLDADSPVQVTRVMAGAGQPFWSPDSSRVWFLSDDRVWSVGRAGGEPELAQKEEVAAAALSPDGKTLATWRITTAKNVTRGSVWLASPALAEPREYVPAPFAVKGGWVPNYLRFSPDGTRILAAFNEAESVAVWLLPFPDGPGARAQPHLLLSKNPPWQMPPWFSWMPDSRHVVMAFRETSASPARLWMVDTRAETLVPLTAGVNDEGQPDVSPDGSKIVFTSGGVDHDLVEVPLDGAPTRDVLATSRNEHSAAWVPGAARFVYMTDRSGQEEIRLRSASENWDRPIVTPRDFPNDPTLLLRAPVVSPDGERVAYDRRPMNGSMAIWVSPITGGAPARLTQSAAEHYSPTWSPDGAWIAFFLNEGGVERLARSRVGSSEPPQTLVEGGMTPTIPAWSPTGNWIAYVNAEGVNLVRPDGKAKQPPCESPRARASLVPRRRHDLRRRAAGGRDLATRVPGREHRRREGREPLRHANSVRDAYLPRAAIHRVSGRQELSGHDPACPHGSVAARRLRRAPRAPRLVSTTPVRVPSGRRWAIDGPRPPLRDQSAELTRLRRTAAGRASRCAVP